MQFSVFDPERDAYQQNLRISGMLGTALLSIVLLFIATTVPPKAPQVYQYELMLFFQSAFVISVFCLLSLLFLWIINLNNGHPISGDRIQELSFYAREDSDIAFFLEDIREKEDRLPVLDEYVQILSFAHKENLRIYHHHKSELS